MSISFSVDPVSEIVHVTTSGAPSIDEQRKVWEQILRSPNARRPLRVLDDRRGLVQSAEPAEVRAAVAVAEKLIEALRGARIAAVVPKAVSFGLSRMFQSHADGLPFELRAFYDIDEAARWLSDGDGGD